MSHHWNFKLTINAKFGRCVQLLIEKYFFFRSDDFEGKVEELTHRLEAQTAEVLRLTLELEEYEYKDYGTANNSNTLQNEEEDSDYEYVDDDDEVDGKEPW